MKSVSHQGRKEVRHQKSGGHNNHQNDPFSTLFDPVSDFTTRDHLVLHQKNHQLTRRQTNYRPS